MQRFLPALTCCLCLLLGLSVGWYFGFTRHSVKNQRKLVNEYQALRDTFGMTDEQLAEIGKQLPTLRRQMAREDEMAAAMALGALAKLERGDVEKTRSILERTVSIYFRGHQHDGNSNVLRNIEKFAATSASLSNAIYRKLE